MGLFSNFVNSLSSGVSQQMAPTVKKPVAPVSPVVKPVTTSNPSASSPVVKTPAAQKYIASQLPIKTQTPVTSPPPVANTQNYTYQAPPQAPTTSVQAPQSAPPTSTSRDAYINAYKKYTESIKQNENEKVARENYNNMVADVTKSIAGREGRGLGVPLNLVRGEQEKLLKQQQPELTRLQNQIGIEQDSNKAIIDSAKSNVDFEKELLGLDTEAKKPIVVDGVAYERQTDGTLKPLTEKVKSPSEQYGTGAIGEYNFAKENGYEGTFSQYQNEDANRKRSIAAAGVAGGGLTPAQVNTTVNSIAGAFDNEPIVKSYNTVKEGYNTIKNIGINSTSPADDIAFIYAFAKIMDPNSVVREGEYNTIQKYAQSWADNFGFNAKRLYSNTNFLTPVAKQKMLNTLESKIKTIDGQYTNLSKEYQRQVDDAYSGKPRQITNYAGGTKLDSITTNSSGITSSGLKYTVTP